MEKSKLRGLKKNVQNWTSTSKVIAFSIKKVVSSLQTHCTYENDQKTKGHVKINKYTKPRSQKKRGKLAQ